MVDKDIDNFNLINKFSYFNNFSMEHIEPSMCKGDVSIIVEPGVQFFKLGKP